MNIQVSEAPSENSFNKITFYDHEVIATNTRSFSTGKRLDIAIVNPKSHVKYFLNAWENTGIFDAIDSIGGLNPGDIITVDGAEMWHYKQKNEDEKGEEKVIYKTAYNLSPETNLIIKRPPKQEEKKDKVLNDPRCFSASELMARMLG